MQRRSLLAALGAGSIGLAGCLTDSLSSGTPEDGTPGELPEGCPTTQGLDVEWPQELDADSVESFVRAYEPRYYREQVVGYEPETSLDRYELGGSVDESPTERGDGWVLEYAGGGAVYRPSLSLTATTATPPEDADVVDGGQITDDRLHSLFENAASSGEATTRVEQTREDIDRYIELFDSLSAAFNPLTGPGESETLYVAVEDTTLKLTVHTTSLHGDYWWQAAYYVDAHVVRRAGDAAGDPRDGTLLECRTDG